MTWSTEITRTRTWWANLSPVLHLPSGWLRASRLQMRHEQPQSSIPFAIMNRCPCRCFDSGVLRFWFRVHPRIRTLDSEFNYSRLNVSPLCRPMSPAGISVCPSPYISRQRQGRSWRCGQRSARGGNRERDLYPKRKRRERLLLARVGNRSTSVHER